MILVFTMGYGTGETNIATIDPAYSVPCVGDTIRLPDRGEQKVRSVSWEVRQGKNEDKLIAFVDVGK